MPKPLCFVLMPFGTKPTPAGGSIDFDRVYKEIIQPAICDTGLETIRADEEKMGGIIHKPMFERLILCDYAVADLTLGNPNVFYELGVRHAVRPARTVLISAKGYAAPFDLAPVRQVQYELTPAGIPARATDDSALLREHLRYAKDEASAARHDSPVYQLVDFMRAPEIDHAKTDLLRASVQYSEDAKKRLAEARKQGVAGVDAAREALGPLDHVEFGVVLDLFLSYRAVEAWDRMIELVEKMPKDLRQTPMVQEQLGLALNRAGRGDEAEAALKRLIAARGAHPETMGILGRIYKDRWKAALKAGDRALARGMLDKAIETYRKGFEADWRDAYPGINAVTLMEQRNPPHKDRDVLLPVVRYAVERKIASGKSDYWDYATRLELAVLANDQEAGEQALSDALANLPPTELWQAKTTAGTLQTFREVREARGEKTPEWVQEAEKSLTARAAKT